MGLAGIEKKFCLEVVTKKVVGEQRRKEERRIVERVKQTPSPDCIQLVR